jgi:lipopolysaccharide/colanic/teichoic acid biosynthesis glycosyltransferase
MEQKRTCIFLIRFFDILFSAFAILVLIPFMLPIMIILKMTGEHYIFYKQARVGRYGKDFGLLKFATMLKDSPNLPGGTFTLKNDSRILPLGKFLRKTKINELPQLINIFLGQMSIIGYRPLLRKGYDTYSAETKQRLYNLIPGLSGIASIILRNEEEIIQKMDNKDDFYNNIIMPYKGKLESWFVDNYTLLNYFKIMFVTVIIVLQPSSCMREKTFRNLPSAPEQLERYLYEA